MRGRDTTLLSEILPAEERAVERVVARYQRVSGAVTRFARTLAGDDELQVRLGARAAAGDTGIVLDPAVFQAAYARAAPVTPEEVALASALHEVVHLVSSNFEERRPLPPHWYRIANPPRSDEEPESPPSDQPSDEPMELLDALTAVGGAAAEALFFAVEDARQERQGLASYPGARSVLADLYRAALPRALAESGALSQFALGCFLLVGDYVDRDRLERRSDARVAVALADAEPFLAAIAEADDPWIVAEHALGLLGIARIHGLVVEEKTGESKTRREAREKADRQAISEGVDRVRLLSPIVQDAEGYERTRAAEHAAGLSERSGPSEMAGEASTDQILRVSQAPTIYLPTGQGGKLVVGSVPRRFSRFGAEGRAAIDEAARRWEVDQRRVGGELHPLFVANQRRGLRSGYDAGDLSPHAALFLGAGLYQRMYERRALRTRRSYAVSLLVDGSASMLQPSRSGEGAWGLAAATLGAWTLARMCDELQVDFEVALFNRAFAAVEDDTEWSFTRRRHQAIAGLRRTQGDAAKRLTTTVNHYLVKRFEEPWRRAEDVMAGLFYAAAHPRDAAQRARRAPEDAPPVSMFDKGANVDEFNVSHAADRLARHGAQARVLVVLADGMTRGSVDALAAAVDATEHTGTTVLGIGIGDGTVETAYGRHQVVARPDALAQAIVGGVRSALRRSLAMWGMGGWWVRAVQSSTEPRRPKERIRA